MYGSSKMGCIIYLISYNSYNVYIQFNVVAYCFFNTRNIDICVPENHSSQTWTKDNVSLRKIHKSCGLSWGGLVSITNHRYIQDEEKQDIPTLLKPNNINTKTTETTYLVDIDKKNKHSQIQLILKKKTLLLMTSSCHPNLIISAPKE